MKKKHNINEYLDICRNLESAGVSVDLLLLLYEKPYVNVRSYNSVQYVGNYYVDKEVEFNLHSFDLSKRTCNLTIFVNLTETVPD